MMILNLQCLTQTAIWTAAVVTPPASGEAITGSDADVGISGSDADVVITGSDT